MKKITVIGLLSILFLSGVTLAQQSDEQKKSSSMRGMMQEMMKGDQGGEGDKEGMGRMMKMMEQCGAMMERCCSTNDTGKTEGSQSK